jgi:CHAT domain-containing protein
MTNRRRTIAAGISIVFLLSIGGTAVAHNSSTSRENDNDAQQARAQAEALRTKWTETSLRESAEQFQKAARIWISLGDFSNAALATLKSGDAYFDLSEYREALKRYQDASVLALKKQDWLTEAKASTQLARVEIYFGHNDVAQRYITRAIDLLVRDQQNLTPLAKNAYGAALTTQGELAQATGNFKKALTYFEKALGFLDGDQNDQARVHLFNGYIKGSIGSLDNALAEINQALKLYQAVNNKAGEGQAISALGLVHLQQQDHDQTIQQIKSALDIFRAIGDRHSEAIANNSLGQVYELLNQPQLALKYYQDALHLFEEAGAVNGIAPTNCLVAGAYVRNNDPDQALRYYGRCLNLSHSAGMIRIEVHALTDIANLYVAQQRFELALAQHQKIQKFFERIGDQRGLETAFSLSADLLFQTGQKQKAAEAYQRVVSLSEQIGDKDGEIAALYGLAGANMALGAPEVALTFIQRSLKLIEELRSNVASPEFRSSYFSGVQQHYDLCIKILAQLDRLHPGKGFDAEALLVNEKRRARLLHDLISESHAKIREGAAKELLDRELELRGLIRAQAEYRMGLASTKTDPAERAEVENQLAELKAQYQQVETQLRQQNPHLSSVEQSAPLSLDQIQKELRDGNTMLLEYFLGDEGSYLWAVTSDSFQMIDLPARKTIEGAEHDFYASATALQGIKGETTESYQAKIEAANKDSGQMGRQLTDMLLGPVSAQLGNKRLVLVVEGGLQYVPFAALPSPASPGRLLIETNEIVFEPSFSSLIAIRNNISQHTSSRNKLVAVIADPVLTRNDDRVQSQSLAPSTALASTEKTITPDAQFTRLAHSSEEADAISAVAPWFTTKVAKGFDASRETAISAEVGQYQIVHFATHGVVDTEHPELSGIVLTMFDRTGVKKDGLMPLHDIYSLDLSAELTVLSACQTAIGKDIKGEGFVGLSHAFISAGSKSVVASLWNVDDRATAVLMRHFYEAMLHQGMSPAAALRTAQLKMMRDKSSSAPYYWAGFVLQGEYTNRITVDHNSSLRVSLAVLGLLSLVTAGVLLFQRRRRRISPTQSS